MLEKIDPEGPLNWDKKEIKKRNKELLAEIAERQKLLYADGKKSILIILQGLDAAGKDGTIRTIFKGINPLGCNVVSFKKPTDEEFEHDFLWRIHKKVPRAGMIHIFNRSHYEDILVPKVEGYFSDEVIETRYSHINNFESLLQDNGTIVLKFYLHISKTEQFERLTERLENREKFWKHNDGDWESREKWDNYMKVYETLFTKCNTVPWVIVPSNRNWVKINYIASAILVAMRELDLKWPTLESTRFKNPEV